MIGISYATTQPSAGIADYFIRSWLSRLASLTCARSSRAKSLFRVGALAVLYFVSQAVVAKAEEYELGPQDRVRVSIVEWFPGTGEMRSPVNGEYLVGPTGNISMPLLGEIAAGGIHPAELANRIAARVQERLSLAERPSTSIEVIQFRPFFVLGDVEKQGEYEARPGMTVLRAISIAGGLYRANQSELRSAEREVATASSELMTTSARIPELQIRRARLLSEFHNTAAVDLPPELLPRKDEPAIANALRLERAIFEARRQTRRAAAEAQRRTISLLDAEATAIQAQIGSMRRQEEVLQRQAENMRTLQSRGLATAGREMEFERLLGDVEIKRQELGAKLLRLQQESVRIEEEGGAKQGRYNHDVAVELQQVNERVDELVQKSQSAERKLSMAERSVDQVREPMYRILRRRPSGEDIEVQAAGGTSLRPGDMLIVEANHARSRLVGSTVAGGGEMDRGAQALDPAERAPR